MAGRTIGRYRILSLIGEGGVGAVYRAVHENADFEQPVAIKLLKRGMDSTAILRRFRDERRILARLDHPNIARFLDGGIADDGRPYFVMEYLEGTPIHRYCRDRNLTVRERLELFLPVCAAVAYSHRNLVIHRDLKASNILVSELGTPKLLDFGIAKLLDRDTSSAIADATLPVDRMMTPDYASPEQIRGEPITTAADVYSLGVLLYELLTDQRPRQLAGLSAAEMIRAVETDPPKPSAMAPRGRARDLEGDVDTIIAKAMHRSAERRYASAQQLADDIRRHLAGLPVHARPDTVVYRLRKFASRHRAGFLAAALALAAFCFGLFAAVWQSGVIAAKERESQKRFGEIRDLANGLLGELDAELENVPGATAAREILARKVLHYLDLLARDEVRDLSLQRDLAVAYERLGEILGGSKASNLGKPAAALEAYRKSLAIHDRIAQRNPPDFTYLRDHARALSKYSDILALTGDHPGALEQEERSLAIRKRWLAARPGDPNAKRAVAGSLQELAGDLDRVGRFSEALAHRRQVIAILEEVNATTPPDTAVRMALALAYKRLGRSLLRARQTLEAQHYFEKAVHIETAEVAKNPSATGTRSSLAFSLNDLGMAYAQKGDTRRAMDTFRESLRIRTALAAADPNDWRAWNLLATTRFHLGNAIVAGGDWRGGVGELKASLDLRRKLSERSPNNAGALAEVAETWAALGDAMVWAVPPDAVPYYEKALAIYLELSESGRLSAESSGEPARIRAAIARIRKR